MVELVKVVIPQCTPSSYVKFLLFFSRIKRLVLSICIHLRYKKLYKIIGIQIASVRFIIYTILGFCSLRIRRIILWSYLIFFPTTDKSILIKLIFHFSIFLYLRIPQSRLNHLNNFSWFKFILISNRYLLFFYQPSYSVYHFFLLFCQFIILIKLYR